MSLRAKRSNLYYRDRHVGRRRLPPRDDNNMNRLILHIDFDSFFASVAQQFNPLLRNRPIGITAANGRTAIIAASREAKAQGIKSPSRTYDAQKICPSIVFVKADFNLYWEISKKFIDICKDYTPFVEIFSLDEVFMDVTKTAHLFGGVYPLIKQIKTRLEKEIGEYITVSVGISHNKLLAKLASGLDKPCGLVEIKPENIKDIYKRAKLIDICGIGTRIQLRLNQMGIYTLSQLYTAPLRSLIAEFGDVEGNFLKNVGLGIDETPIVPYTDAPSAKSVGRNYCLPQNEYDKRVVLQNIYELCEEVGIKLRKLDKKARAVGIGLRGQDNFFARRTFITFMNQGKELFEACCYLIHSSSQLFPEYVRQIGIWVSYLEDSKKVTSSIFETSKQKRLWQTVDHLNEKFGHHTIRNGFLLYADKLTTVPNGFLSDRYELKKFAEDEQTRLDNLSD